LSSIAENIQAATQVLQENGIRDARREANSLLAFALEKENAFLIAHSEYQLSNTEETRFNELLKRRASREPLQYITGRQEFFGLDFEVSPGVLIPRPETESIVENAVEILRKIENPRFCEIGVGSGCISISILHKLKTAHAFAGDVSEKAIRIAQRNAEKHHVSERLDLKTSDLFGAFQNEKFDLIVSNPPYISSADFEALQPEVRNFEPRDALTDGQNGLSVIEQIIIQSPNFLKPGAFLLMEIGFGQADEIHKMFSKENWQTVEILPDLQGIPRTVKALKSKK
jgi:release factor glutamine methyltransferase